MKQLESKKSSQNILESLLSSIKYEGLEDRLLRLQKKNKNSTALKP